MTTPTPASRDAFLAEAKRLGLAIPPARADELHANHARLQALAQRVRAGLVPADDLALALDRRPR